MESNDRIVRSGQPLLTVFSAREVKILQTILRNKRRDLLVAIAARKGISAFHREVQALEDELCTVDGILNFKVPSHLENAMMRANRAVPVSVDDEKVL